MRETLRQEIEGFLRLHGPSTGTAIALGVMSRHEHVDSILASGGFEVVQRPEGASPRATYWNVSQRVPQRKSSTKRSRQMLSVLQDGQPHSRDEILERVRERYGKFILTNNAAAELRAQGYDVRHERKRGVDFYWIDRAEHGSLDAASSSPLPGRTETPTVEEAASSEPMQLLEVIAGGAEPHRRGAYDDEQGAA